MKNEIVSKKIIMAYGVQHNGKGKYHLIPKEGDGCELCKSYGTFLFSHASTFEFIGNDLFEISPYCSGKRLISEFEIDLEFCKKCIKKAIKCGRPQNEILKKKV